MSDISKGKSYIVMDIFRRTVFSTLETFTFAETGIDHLDERSEIGDSRGWRSREQRTDESGLSGGQGHECQV